MMGNSIKKQKEKLKLTADHYWGKYLLMNYRLYIWQVIISIVLYQLPGLINKYCRDQKQHNSSKMAFDTQQTTPLMLIIGIFYF